MIPSELLFQESAKLGMDLSDHQLDSFMVYLQELALWNEKFNLTAIDDPKEIVIKHFLDSLLGLKVYTPPEGSYILDLGTGAGFPGIPWKIMRPDISLYLVDSLKKRIGFLDHMASVLKLNNVESIHGRAEDLAQMPIYREKMDVVVSRAVARLNVLSELSLPFVKVGGVFLAMKGPDGETELQEANGAIKKLGGQMFHVEHLNLPVLGDERTLILINKIQPSDKQYPRKAGTPAKKPL